MSFFTQLSNIFGSKSPKSKSREDSPTKGESESTTQTEEKTKSHMAEYIRQGETLIGFVTDLEGNLSYWENYKKISQVLEIDSNGELTLRKNCYFVHGGDVVDRGNGDIRILKDLISLHTRFPDRVFFIIGNRDANKLRFPFSLHEQVLKYKPNAFWVADSQVPADFPLNNVKEKIQWVLKATMGAPFAYENHRQELQEIFPDKEATDEAILDSFNNLIHPRHTDNLLFQYLKAGSMAVIIGDVLFVHGAVTSFQLGFVPPSYDRANNRTTETQFINDPYAWSNAINAFLKSELRDYEDSFDSYRAQIANTTSWDELKELLWDTKGDYESSQPGSRLVQCGMGMKVDKSPNPGTTYASYLSNGKPVRIEEIVANWLHSGGINKVIVGHQPNGDTPLIIDHLNVLTISADSSYSKFLMWQIRDFARASFLSEADRAKLAESTTPDEFVGSDKMYTAHLQQTLPPATKPSEQANTRSALAVNEVVISFNQPVGPINTPSSQSAIGRVTVHGIISLGAEYCWSEDPFVGKETKDGWFVKAANARFHDDPRTYYVLAQSEGFNFRSKLVLASEIQNLFASA